MTESTRKTVGALAVGVIIFVAMRFFVPETLDSNVRSAIAAVVAFIAARTVSNLWTERGKL